MLRSYRLIPIIAARQELTVLGVLFICKSLQLVQGSPFHAINPCQRYDILFQPQISLRAVPVLIYPLLKDTIRFVLRIVIDMAYITHSHNIFHQRQCPIIAADDLFRRNIVPAGLHTGGNFFVCGSNRAIG